MPLTTQHNKFLDAATAIRLDPDKTEAAFIARQLVQATLPHRNPGDVPLWSRTNGNLTLTIQPGHSDGKIIGYPYGTIPRLLLFWITTEAIRTKSPRLQLGETLADFMRQLDLDPHSRGKRSDAKRLREQMRRLFKATISFEQKTEENGRIRESWLDMKVAPEAVLWWDDKYPQQIALWESWVELSKQFYNAVTAAPVPVDMRVLKALKHSPLALDLYAWATYTAYRTQQTDQSRTVPWKSLHEQLGAEYGDIKEFARKAREALHAVQAVYPELGLEFERGAVRVLPCNPSVTVTKPKAGQKTTG